MVTMTFDRSVQGDKNALIAELRQAGSIQRGNVYSCPFHDDKNPSGGVFQGTDGIWRFKCHAGSCGFHGDIFDVRAKRRGVDLPTVFREESNTMADSFQTPPGVAEMSKVYASLDEIIKKVERLGKIETVYKYQEGVDFAERFAVIRYVNGDGKKKFSQATKTTNGWLNSGPPKPMPLYNLESVIRAKTVIVVEGEKCVEALRDCGHVATTSAGGSGSAANSYWETLSGKTVYLWPDNDDAGLKYMAAIMEIFKTFENPPISYWINPGDLGLQEKGDAFDYLEQSKDRTITERHKLIGCVLRLAEPTGPSSRVAKRLGEYIDGTRKVIHWKWSTLSGMTKALMPGTITMICGTPGSAKSFFLLENMMHWHSQDIPVALMELEEDQTYHLMRCAAILQQDSRVLDPDWANENPKEARDIWREAEPFIAGFGDKIFESQNPNMDYSELIKWVIDRIKAKCRIIAVDPISALDTGDKASWNEDKRFVREVGGLLAKSESSLILITHPRGGKYNETDLQNISGGSAFARFTQTAIWIESLPERKAFEVKKNHEINMTVMANRIIRILKARNGRGAGARVAYDFSNDTLGFQELGLITNKEKKEKRGGDDD